MINVQTFILSAYSTNCYLAYSEGPKEAFVVDPGAASPQLKAAIDGLGLEPKYIILTHGHGDHTGGIDFLRENYPGIRLVAASKEAKLLYDRNHSYGSGGIVADINVNDGDEITVGNMKLKFIGTPGHTPGGMCILVDGILFSGDTLFRASIGRTDFYGGSFEELMDSIKNKLFLLPEDTKVLPGHMGATTIGYEMRNNPFVQDIR